MLRGFQIDTVHLVFNTGCDDHSANAGLSKKPKAVIDGGTLKRE